MPMVSRNARNREAAKRQIMGTLDDNVLHEVDSRSSVTKGTADSSHVVSKALDGTKPEQVRLLIKDLEGEMAKRIEIISARALQANQAQQETMFLGTMKLDKLNRKMTVRDFNKTHGCDLLSTLKGIMNNSQQSDSAGQKRSRPPMTSNNMQTPARSFAAMSLKTPGTISRTAKKGEVVFSQNGSPIDHTEEGDLVATVSKKRRGNDNDPIDASFDLNVGEGQYINLADVNNVKNMNMEDTAMSQINMLQDQLASLMALYKN